MSKLNYPQNPELIARLKSYAQDVIAVLDDMSRGMAQTAACAAHGLDLRAFRHILYRPMQQLQETSHPDFGVLLGPWEKLWLAVFELSPDGVTAMPDNLEHLFQVAFDMAGLDHRQRTVLRAIYVDGGSVRGIGAGMQISGARASQVHTKALARLRQPDVKLVLRYGKEYVEKCDELRREWAEAAKAESDRNLQSLRESLKDAVDRNDLAGLRMLRSQIDSDIKMLSMKTENRISVFDPVLGLSPELAEDLSTHGLKTLTDVYFASPSSLNFMSDRHRNELDAFMEAKGIRLLTDREAAAALMPDVRLDLDILDLPLSVRSKNALVQNDIRLLSDLIGWTDADLLSLRHLGESSVQEVVRVAADHGVVIPKGPRTGRSVRNQPDRRTYR